MNMQSSYAILCDDELAHVRMRRLRDASNNAVVETSPVLRIIMLDWLALVAQYCLVCNLAMASFHSTQSLYPRPALYDIQLTSSIQVKVEFSGVSQDVRTTFSFHSHSQCVRGETYNYTLLVWQEGGTQPTHVEGPFPVSSCEERMSVTAHNLHRSRHYTAIVVAYNDYVSLKSKKIDLYTSAVQRVNVVKGEECVMVTCHFATGSNAQGCVVKMRIATTYTSQHLHSWTFNVSQNPDLLSGTLHVPLEPKTSAVDVAVYDLTASGRAGFLSIPPHISHTNGLYCELGVTVTPFKEKAKMALFYISACFFIAGLLVICVGMLCKVGHLHRHFRNKSYEILEGRGSTQHYNNSRSTSCNEDLERLKCRTKLQPLHVQSSQKQCSKAYGSYEALESAAVGELMRGEGFRGTADPVPDPAYFQEGTPQNVS